MNALKQLLGIHDSPADTAKKRLRMALINDRSGIPPGMLDLMKDDIVSVIARRVPVDRAGVTMHLDNTRYEHRLLVDIPLLMDEGRRPSGRTVTQSSNPKQRRL